MDSPDEKADTLSTTTRTTSHTTTDLYDPPAPVRAKLAAAWTSFMFLYVYVDIFAFYKPGVVEDILAGVVWEFDITPTWAITALSLLAVPSLADHLPAFMPLQDGPDAGADHVVIVGNQDACHGEPSFRGPVPAAVPGSRSQRAGYTSRQPSSPAQNPETAGGRP